LNESNEHDADSSQRDGDPLDGLWHWSSHPMARFGITVGVLIALVLFFIALAQLTF